MDTIFSFINRFFSFLEPITNTVWEFPTNLASYRTIPILGQLSFSVMLLIGVGIYFSVRLRFIQTISIRPAIKIILTQQKNKKGISALGAFMLGLAMRMGPGNIVGITGAIAIGGPGALFWMWIAAFFGMATAFTESVLAQIYKEKKSNEFVGGLPFYGQRLLGNSRFVGLFLSCCFILYALFNLPAQTFNIFSSISNIAKITTNVNYGNQSLLYYCIAIILIFCCSFIIFGGIRRVVAYADFLVPLKAGTFSILSLIIIFVNFPLIPYFLQEVFMGAFFPQAIWGGTIGTALSQGVKRGLMSNEAGQGTITMAAAVADSRHPCEQGFVQSFAVFFDTIIICTLTGFIVVIAHIWTNDVDGVVWNSVKESNIQLYLTSIKSLAPPILSKAVEIVMCACYGLFAFTTLLGMISFAEISANFISRRASVILLIRILGSFVFVPLGALTILTGLELSNLWSISDLMNITMVCLNIPLLLVGLPIVKKTLNHYYQYPNKQFISQEIGIKTSYWK